MATTVQDMYTQVVSTLSPTERLQLATLILNDFGQHNATIVDESDTWTEQDQYDLTTFSLSYAARIMDDCEAVTE